MPYADPEKRRARKAERFREQWQDPEFREKHRARNRDNYHRNGHKWRGNQPAELTAKSANTQAQKLGVPGLLTAEDVERMWADQPACLSCGRGRGLDHIRAMTNGGTNTPDNIQNLCGPCNQAKHKWDLSPEEIVRPPFDGDSIRCRRGHLRSEHTYTYPGSGRRICGQCHRESVNRYRARRKAAA